MDSGTILVTKTGHARVSQQLNALKREHMQLNEEIATALEGKSAEENDEFLLAKMRQNQIEKKITTLTEDFDRFEIVEEITFTGAAAFGTSVSVTNLDTGIEKEYSLLSEYDSNVKAGIISINSPIGAGLLGKRSGDTVEIEMPNGSVIPYEVNSVGVSKHVSLSQANA
jgi:transcription elongation factor GreA